MMVGFSIIQKETIINSSIRQNREESRSPTQRKICLSARFGIFTGRPVGNGDETMKYPVIIHKDENSDYGVTFPDLPGCFSAGETIEAALANAQEAAECHVEGILLDSEPIPVATAVERYKDDPDYKEGLWALVEVDFSRLSLKSKRVNITMPERLLNSLDYFAKKHGQTRSGLLTQAVTEYMALHQQKNG
jgi:predicted RNase H-like HicB family nuclease